MDWVRMILVIAVTGWFGLTDAKAPIRYMMNSCKSRMPIYVNSSLVLEVTRDFAEDRADIRFQYCAVDVITGPTQKLFLHFQAIDISEEGSTPDRLHIYDYNDDGMRVRVTDQRGIYGVYEFPYYTTNTAGIPVRDYKSSSNKLRVEYFGKPTVMYQGFRVLLTVYRPVKRHGVCERGNMECVNEHICIHPALRCDGLANCGAHDGTDEHNCHGKAEATTDLLESYSVIHAIVAAVVACVVFLLVVLVVACWVNKYKKKHGYKPKPCVRWTNNGGVRSSLVGDLARLYAPPSYESVVVDADDDFGPPPDYNIVAAGGVSLSSESPRDKNTTSELKPSYSSVEVAILHEQPRNPSAEGTDNKHDNDMTSKSQADSDTDQCDSGSREVTSDYVSRDSVSCADSTDTPNKASSSQEKPVLRMVDL